MLQESQVVIRLILPTRMQRVKASLVNCGE